jgi:5-formyltetrahydrofolate cyclo-ligase
MRAEKEKDGQSKAQVEVASSTLKATKRELRSLMKQRLSGISTESINLQSTAVFERLIKFQPYKDARRVSVYLSMPTGEIQTDAIVRHALSCGKQVFVPYIHKSPTKSLDIPRSVMDMVDLRTISDFESLGRDNWGIPTIGADTVDGREHIIENPTNDKQALDVIMIPGVAFDIDPKTSFVRRLGHGKGFYDYFLYRYLQIYGTGAEEPSTRPDSAAMLYGLALEEQLLQSGTDPSVPVGSHDSLLHGLLVGNGDIKEGPVNEA